MMFHKSLAKYYQKWYDDCIDSIAYCKARGYEKAAQEYAEAAERYAKILDEHHEAIAFFSVDGNDGKIDRLLPEKFRGYK